MFAKARPLEEIHVFAKARPLEEIHVFAKARPVEEIHVFRPVEEIHVFRPLEEIHVFRPLEEIHVFRPLEEIHVFAKARPREDSRLLQQSNISTFERNYYKSLHLTFRRDRVNVLLEIPLLSFNILYC